MNYPNTHYSLTSNNANVHLWWEKRDKDDDEEGGAGVREPRRPTGPLMPALATVG